MSSISSSIPISHNSYVMENRATVGHSMGAIVFHLTHRQIYEPLSQRLCSLRDLWLRHIGIKILTNSLSILSSMFQMGIQLLRLASLDITKRINFKLILYTIETLRHTNGINLIFKRHYKAKFISL